jgi:hypothetical protein
MKINRVDRGGLEREGGENGCPLTLWALRMKKNNSIDKHIAKFKMLAVESKIDMTNSLTIELFKETLP